MKSMTVQFHATSDEISGFINSLCSSDDLNLVFMVLHPFSVAILRGEIHAEFLDKHEGDVRFYLMLDDPDLDVGSVSEFLDHNHGAVALEVGRLSGGILQESSVSFMSDELGKYNFAKKIVSKLKKITKAGAVAVNPITGAEANIRSHRFTKGAKEKFDQGVRIVPVAGNSFFKLE